MIPLHYGKAIFILHTVPQTQTHPAMVRPEARALLSGNQAMSVWMGGV